MNLKCVIGLHEWQGCKCRTCGQTRQEGHDWTTDCERCSTCGKTRVNHDWSEDCEKCANCRVTRPGSHPWNGCVCTTCNKKRDDGHDWAKDCGKCARCGMTREGAHMWRNRTCSVCGAAQPYTYHEGIAALQKRIAATPSADDRDRLDRLLGFLSRLKGGGDVNAAGAGGWTALMQACSCGELVIVRLLLQNGAHIDARDQYRWTALMTASNGGHFPIVDFLLSHGADVNAAGKNGNTSLILAAGKGHIDVVRLLLERGAYIDAQDGAGYTAETMADYEKQAEVAAFLADYRVEALRQTDEAPPARKEEVSGPSVDTASITLPPAPDEVCAADASAPLQVHAQNRTGDVTNAPGHERLIDLGSGTELHTVWIPATTSAAWKRISGGRDCFIMGGGDYEDELQHDVVLTTGFWMGRYPVTQRQWLAVMGNNPSKCEGAGMDAPVENVSWDDCQLFLKKVTGVSPTGVPRLPTEAEWEYACRAGTTTAFNTGKDEAALDRAGWYGAGWDDAKGGEDYTTHPVGQKEPNAWGLYDMHGNVDEWCEDRYGPYTTGRQENPQGDVTGYDRVCRGGSFGNLAVGCCSHTRHHQSHDTRMPIGFRIVVS